MLAALLISGLCVSAIADGAYTAGPPVLITNLFQLQHCAEKNPAVVHPLRIVAKVLDVDFADDVLVLRDDSDVEFVQLDIRDRDIKPGGHGVSGRARMRCEAQRLRPGDCPGNGCG